MVKELHIDIIIILYCGPVHIPLKGMLYVIILLVQLVIIVELDFNYLPSCLLAMVYTISQSNIVLV